MKHKDKDDEYVTRGMLREELARFEGRIEKRLEQRLERVGERIEKRIEERIVREIAEVVHDFMQQVDERCKALAKENRAFHQEMTAVHTRLGMTEAKIEQAAVALS